MAAEIALAGMDPIRFMRSRDPEELDLMQLIAMASRKIRNRDLENLAVLIANKVGDLFPRS